MDWLLFLLLSGALLVLCQFHNEDPPARKCPFQSPTQKPQLQAEPEKREGRWLPGNPMILQTKFPDKHGFCRKRYPWKSPESTRSIPCTSCSEYVGKKCRKNLGTCQSKYPDFTCQTKEVYTLHFTGEYVYQYSVLQCPKRCVEYVRITDLEKNVIFCCNQSYCNSLSVKDVVPYIPTIYETIE